MQPKAFITTLGCRLNQSESSIIAKNLEIKGYRISELSEKNDLCVINTCTVTANSDAKCRQTIRSLQRKNPNALIAVIGCFSQMGSQEIKKIGGIDLIVGNQKKLHLHEFLDEVLNSDETVIKIDKIEKTPFSINAIGQTLKTTRANLKIQDGCDFICAFCIIPFARGRSRSRVFENLIDEAIKLSEMGIKEIILTGVNIGTYEYKNKNLFDILDQLEKTKGIERIRISSIEPTTITSYVFSYMKDPQSKVLPYLHIPVQSASDSILLSMRRKYKYKEFFKFISEAIEKVPRICIGSDVMVGFPGETDQMFQQTIENLRSSPLHYFHVFPYSERKSTRSEKLGGKVSQETITHRAIKLRDLSDFKKAKFIGSQRKKIFKVLFEEIDSQNMNQGYTENYVRVKVQHSENLKNQILETKITGVNLNFATGELL